MHHSRLTIGLAAALLTLIILGVSSLPALAQQSGATIAGTVRDSVGRPIADAEVILQPGRHRLRTDTAGNFIVTGLDGGKYVVAARKVGYAIDRWDAEVSRNGRIEVKLVLALQPQQLDAVVASARRDCAALSVSGFECRRRGGGGVFLDFEDIDEKEPVYVADVFHDIPGFRVDLRRTRRGPVRVPVREGNHGCITSLVNGRKVTMANVLSMDPMDVIAMEVYLKADSVPGPYQRYTWPDVDVGRTGRCSVVVYWTFGTR